MRRIIAMLLTLVMVLSVTAAVSATETEAALVLDAACSESTVDVTVSLEGCDGVTNGRFVVSYDADVLTLVGVQVSDAYAMNSVNIETAGAVALAWIGSQLTAEKTLMLTLAFEMDPANTADTTITAEPDGVYAGTEAVDTAADSVTVSAAQEDAVDKSALEEAIAKAEALDESKYTEESFAAVEDALENAKAVLADADATQEEVDAAAKALNDAMAALVEKETEPTEAPTEAPTEVPTEEPTEAPTAAPTEEPTEAPTAAPTEGPTEAPTAAPTEAPTKAPSKDPDTGDHTQTGLFAALALMSLAGIAALTAWNKRRNMA